LEKTAIPGKDYSPSQDFSEHSDLEPFLMTAEELESRHAHELHYRQRLLQGEWLKKSV
jgi:hypothetical protein